MTLSDRLPTVEVLLQGFSLDTNVGLAGFCMVTLVEGVDASGERKRILFDPAHVGRRILLWEALAKRGLRPRDIDGVVLSHSHWDHIQNIDVFDHAPIMIHPAERAYSLQPHRNDWATPAWTGTILERQRLVEVAEGDQLLQGVRVVDMPGHTPGGIGLSVETATGLAVVAGDALHHARVALLGENPLIFWDRKAASDTIARVVKMADVIYPGHDRVFRLTADNAVEYLEDFQMTISNVSDSLDDLDFEVAKPGQWIMPDIAEQQAVRAEYEQAAEARRGQVLGQLEDGWVCWWEVDPELPGR
ncbi:MAG TPA: MBL fold metallo-hydrolase [Mycobacteriales bacterium]|nr:MBL fold metallo-hydrolase [Mycobacteriales bacterium]